jgi:hypothetical protein
VKAVVMGFVTNLNSWATVLFVLVAVTGGTDALDPADETGGGVAGVLAGLIVDLVWLGAMLLWLQRRYPDWRRSLGAELDRAGLRSGLWGALVGVPLYLGVAFVVGLSLTVLFEELSGKDVSTPEQVPGDLSALAAVVVVVLAVAIAPIVEELCFRGLIFRAVRDRHGFWPGAIVSGLLFGLVHYVPFNPLPDTVLLQSVMVFTGIGLAWIYERRGSLFAPIGAHMAFNTIGVILILTAT